MNSFGVFHAGNEEEMTATGLIEVSPPSMLTFSLAEESKRVAVRAPKPSTNLRISNISSEHSIAFRIQTTAPEAFIVHPVFGTVHPGCVQEVSVCSRDANYDVRRESFLAQAAIVDGKAAIPKELWAHLAPEKIQGWTLSAGLNTTRKFQTATGGYRCCVCFAGISACFTTRKKPKVKVHTQPASRRSTSPMKVSIAEDPEKDSKASREAAAAAARERFLKAQSRGRAFSLQNTQPLREDTCGLQLVQLNAVERLTFVEGSNPSALLTVKNMSTTVVLFRIQVTTLETIHVSPVGGSVNVGESQEVTVTLRGPIDAQNDKILVQAAVLRDDLSGDANDLWSKLSEKDIQAQKLVVAFAGDTPCDRPGVNNRRARSVVRQTRVEDREQPMDSTSASCSKWCSPRSDDAAHPRNNVVRVGSCFWSCGSGAKTDQEQEINFNLLSEPAQLENGELKVEDSDDSDASDDDHVSTQASEASSALRVYRPSDNSLG
mmetsp:Transcript_33072/g.88640  ORF Transcript_33072/g.88640 Transcript_33072/m.88640 type:complete len:490 (-) Transcript_33072:450-1919(-)